MLLGTKRLSIKLIMLKRPARLPNKNNKDNANSKRDREQNQVNGHGTILKNAVRQRVQSRLAEVEQACQANDQAVNLAEGGEAKDFGCIVTIKFLVSFANLVFLYG